MGHQRSRCPGRSADAVGAKCAYKVQQGEARFDVTLRYQKQFATHARRSKTCAAVAFRRTYFTCSIDEVQRTMAREVYREGGQRYNRD